VNRREARLWQKITIFEAQIQRTQSEIQALVSTAQSGSAPPGQAAIANRSLVSRTTLLRNEAALKKLDGQIEALHKQLEMVV